MTSESNIFSGDEDRLTLRFTYFPAQRLTWQLSGSYANYNYDKSSIGQVG